MRNDKAVIDAYLGGGRRRGGGGGRAPPRARRDRWLSPCCRSRADRRLHPEADILNGVAIDVREREIVTIVGPNGAGKSTLMKTIFGLVHAA